MSEKQFTCILIGGPAHGKQEVLTHSLVKPLPQRLNVPLPMKVGGSGNPYAFYRVTGMDVDGEQAVVAVYEALGPELAWPSALYEVRRHRVEQCDKPATEEVAAETAEVQD